MLLLWTQSFQSSLTEHPLEQNTKESESAHTKEREENFNNNHTLLKVAYKMEKSGRTWMSKTGTERCSKTWWALFSRLHREKKIPVFWLYRRNCVNVEFIFVLTRTVWGRSLLTVDLKGGVLRVNSLTPTVCCWLGWGSSGVNRSWWVTNRRRPVCCQ